MQVSSAQYGIHSQLYESENSQVYRGRRHTDDAPVILKILKDAYPSPERIAWFRHEYEIIHHLNLPGVPHVYSIEPLLEQTGTCFSFADTRYAVTGSWLMVMEDSGAESLTRLNLAGTLSIADFLHIASNVTHILGEIHQQHVMHKDINPSNIIYNPTTGETKVIDFSISAMLSREKPAFRNPRVLEGTLAYMSPEQTGRMNRAIDYRTDFYSLGVTFYELLTGQLPFASDDVLELVHSHIARQPAPLYTLMSADKANLHIIKGLSDIIMKLMAKNAEDRYQSAYGIEADLEVIRRSIDTSPDARSMFVVGQHDTSDRFSVPQKLYGRDEHVRVLLDAFEHVSTGNSMLMLVSGHPGIGKTALIQEMHKPITRQRGYFIAGKYDQFQRDIPYSAFIQAFRSLMLHVLSESETDLRIWREKLLAALGANGQVIIDVIPELERIIGTQPPIADAGPLEAQNRFHLVFQHFIQVFTRPKHPLVLVLDDMQWADGASLKLLEALMSTTEGRVGTEGKSLLLIGAYRNNEVSKGHPLALTLQALQETSGTIQELSLGPLDMHDVTNLVAETMHCTPERAQPLAELVHRKTNGNPFFVNEFLRALYVDALITYQPPTATSPASWGWDLQQIQARQITDNVVDFVAGNIQRFHQNIQSLLHIAACIGHQFELKTLAVVSGQAPNDIAHTLEHVVHEGLIIPLSDTYKLVTLGTDVPGLLSSMDVVYMFAHDRIQQAIYSLIPHGEERRLHWRIGQHMLAQPDADVFDSVNQFNQGVPEDMTAWDNTRTPSRIELAKLNLQAGRRARAAAAYEPAWHYLFTGVQLLPQDSAWDTFYNTTLALYVEAAEAASLCGNFTHMEELTSAVIDNAQDILDKALAYEVRIQAATAQNKLLEAVHIALDVLRFFDMSWPEQPEQSDIGAGLQGVYVAVGERPIEDLANLPVMEDAHQKTILRILSHVAHAAYFTIPPLFPLIVFKQVTLSIQYGNAPESAFAYATHGIILCGVVGDVESGNRFATLSLNLIEQLNAKGSQARAMHVINTLVRHWQVHVRETLPKLLEAYQIGLETGDLEYAAVAAHVYCYHSYCIGKHLTEVEREMSDYSDVFRQIKQLLALNIHRPYHQAVLNLLGQSPNPSVLVGDVCDETVMLPHCLETKDVSGAYYLCFNKLVVSYLFHAYEQAVETANMAEQYIGSATGALAFALFYFYDSLARLALIGSQDTLPADIPEHDADTPPIPPMLREGTAEWANLKRVEANQERLYQWAQHAPMNHLHKFYLVEAERCRVVGRDMEAREHYDQAIALAHDNGYINEEALAYELAGQFYVKRNQLKIAACYVGEAHYAYKHWGAKAKVEDVEQRYPNILLRGESASPAKVRTTPRVQTGKSTESELDLMSVVKAGQAISGEIVLATLLRRLLHTVIENAGAQRGVLLLEKDGHLCIEAEGTVDKEDVQVLQSIPVDTSDTSDTNASLPVTMLNYVARVQQSVVLADATQEGQFTQDAYIVAQQPRSILCTPLMHQARLTGILYLENNRMTGAFTEDRIEVLNLLSGQIAVSIENAHLYADVQVKEKKYRTLFEESRDTIYVTTLDGDVIDMNPAGIELFGFTREEALAGNVRSLYANPADRERFVQALTQRGSVRDFEVTLLKKDGTPVECVITSSLRYAEDGSLIGIQSLVRDVTAHKQAERERLRLRAIEEQLDMARTIQQQLLPPPVPEWEALDVFCYNKPAYEVGGDLYAYDAYDTYDTRHKGAGSRATESGYPYMLAIGDVSGKGMPAALLMAVSLASFYSVVKQGLGPGDVLASMDRALVRYTGTTRQNCALACVQMESNSTIRAANAGCIAPIIRHSDGTLLSLDVWGMPLGVGLGAQSGYHEVQCAVEVGDILVFTSDGIIEAVNAQNEMFGFERFEQAIVAGPCTSAEAMVSYIRETVDAFVGDTQQHDDLTLVVVKVGER